MVPFYNVLGHLILQKRYFVHVLGVAVDPLNGSCSSS